VLCRVHSLIKLVHKWDSSWNIVLHNLVIAHLAQVFDNRSQRVAVSHDDYLFAFLDCGADGIIPVRKDSIDCKLKRFSFGEGAVG